jgi:sulfonate transport system substrate-binding protein
MSSAVIEAIASGENHDAAILTRGEAMPISKLKFAALVVLAVASASLPATAESVLRIGYLRGTEPLNLVRIRGTLESALEPIGVKVEWKGPFGAFAPVAEALNADSIDVTVGSSSAALTAMAGDAPISFFAMEWDGGDTMGIVVPKDSPIKTVKDLIGKSVAVNRGGTGEYLLTRALEQAGVPVADVKKAYLSPPDSAAAMSQNKVDAFAAWSTFYPVTQVRLGARVLASAGDIGSENSIVYVVRNDFAKANPKALGILLKMLQEANAWSQANRAEAAAIWDKELKVGQDTATLIASYKINPPVPVRDKERVLLDHQSEWLVQQNILKTKVDLSSHVVTDFGAVKID